MSGAFGNEAGGPAFPHKNPNYDGNWDKEPQRGGMTLRDYFAAKVVSAMVVNATGLGTVSKETRTEAFQQMAQLSYEIADAMLAERSR